MNLFTAQIQELNSTDRKKAALWTEAERKERMTVVIRDTPNPEIERVSIRLGGTTPIKLVGNKSSFTIKKGSLTKTDVLKEIKALPDEELQPVLEDAHKRLLDSLQKSKKSKAAKTDKTKRLKKEEQKFFLIQKQEEQLKIEMNLAKLKREQEKANTPMGS